MSGRRPRVLFVINSLEGGGAERVFATVVSGLRARGDAVPYEVEMALLDRFEEKYPVPADMRRYQLDGRQSVARSVAGLAALALRERPDAIVSFLTRSNVACVLAAKLVGARAIVSERVHTSSHFGDGRGAQAQRALVRLVYPRANAVIAVSGGVAEDLAANFAVPRGRIVVIHNPVDRANARARALEAPAHPLPERFWLAIGRLQPNKNVAMILRAFAASGVSGELVVLGEGPERPRLETLARELGIEGRTRLLGHVGNPFPYLARAWAYLSASNAEGFPNALVEALALGVPVAVTDCESGPAEILDPANAAGPRLRAGSGAAETRVRAAPHGLLVPVEDPDALAAALRRLEPGETRAAQAEAARRRGEAFGLEAAISRYDEVVRAALGAAVG